MHCTPEQLALAALREPLPSRDARHLESCDSCRTRVASLQRGVDALAVPELAATGPGVAPPPAVWAAIAAATEVQASPRPERTRVHGPATAGSEHLAPAVEDLPRARRLAVGQDRKPPGRQTVRPWRRLVLASSAAAVLGAGIALGAVTIAHTSTGTQVAAARLRPVDGSGASGTAVVVRHADHSADLQVTLHGSPPASGYYEAWLADAGLDRMVAVGALHEGTTTLPVPAGVAPDRYPVIDISVQQLDGNPAHSDHSIARGLLG